LVLAAGLVLLGIAEGFFTLALAWVVLGVGMAMGLYDPAFATLTGLYGRAARGPITGITLIAGFASTVGWPLSAFLNAQFGWRAACLIWAALHIVIGLPLNRLLIPRAPPPVRASEIEGEASPAPRGAMTILAFVFAATWFVTGAMAAHLPRLLEIAGAARRRRSPPPSSDLRRLQHVLSSSAPCAWCILWRRHVSPPCSTRSGRSFWGCSDRVRSPPLRCCKARAMGS
jgi:hypothetical protein